MRLKRPAPKAEDHLKPIEREMRRRGLDPDVDTIPDDLWPMALRLEMQARALRAARRDA